MASKKTIGIALIILALVVGVAFAQSHYGEINGITWLRVAGTYPNQKSGSHHIQLQNHDDYGVVVTTSIGQEVGMKAKEDSRLIGCFRDTTITKVVRSRY